MNEALSYGILQPGSIRSCFEAIVNKGENTRCAKCHAARPAFAEMDKKGHECFSNILPGFSSSEVKAPIDLLIIGDSHGGGDEKDFEKVEWSLDELVKKLGAYYLVDDIERFHQYQIRTLLRCLKEPNWVFTDLLKCYVWHNSRNFRLAKEHCSLFLKEQVKILKPRRVLGLGRKVATAANAKVSQHGQKEENITWDDVNIPCYIHSIFPAQHTADMWAKNNGWEPIREALGIE
jgi:hypothetical protein